MNDTGIQAVERWKKKRGGETSPNMKRGKGDEQISQRKKEGHVIFCLFSLGGKKKNQQDSVKREMETLRGNSIE